MIAAIALLIVGAAIGITLAIVVVETWAASDDGRRRMALVDAENRVRDAQTAALNRMADVAADAVYEQTNGGPTTWPSETVVNGEIVAYEERS